MRKHNRIYAMALSVLGLFTVASAGFLLLLVETSAGGDMNTLIPEGALPWLSAINFAYAIAITVTLCARRFRPEMGRVLTRTLNWALLPAMPGGTVVGLYGLLRVDKD